MPQRQIFGPLDAPEASVQVIDMTIDEFEAVRLIDLEGLTQEECAERMAVARTTAQAIYNSARVKLAKCLVNGMELHIDGGDYVLCNDRPANCGCSHCHRKENSAPGDEEP
jgi:uncharacterized protein